MSFIAKIPEQLWNEEFRFLKLKPKDKSPTYDMAKWQENNFKFHDKELLSHLASGGNYGIIGGFGNLVLIDGDSEDVTKLAEELPETFTIKTGSPESYKKHFFFITEEPMSPIRLSKEKVGDLGDIRTTGQYVVAPTCLHPKGGIYSIIKDIPITKISKDVLIEKFKPLISPIENTGEKKEFKPDTKLRNSRFIRECNVPDYCRENKLKGDSSKNWKLFPYLVDILHNRQAAIIVYKEIIEMQGHKSGAITGWITKAREGKIAKCSCKKMKEYLNYYHPDKIEEICKECPLNKKYEKIKNIKKNIDYSKLQKEVMTLLVLKDKDKATELIVKEIKNKNYIYTTRDDIKSEMWVYDKGIYVPQGKTFIREFAREILQEAFTPQLSNAVIAKIEADTYIEHDEFFKTNYINEVPVQNGVLNIFTKKLSPFSPEKIFFNKLNVIYNPSSECEKILKHLRTVLKTEEDVKVMVEIFGYLLLKEYKIEKAFMFVGHGRNGKSKTVELMKRFISVENCSSLPLRSLHDESFSLSELFGKMANLAADLSKTDLRETGMIKALIGRDMIQAKRKYLRDLNFVNYAKMIFAANELPKIYDTTDGFWTKWVLLEFPFKFVTEKVYNLTSEEDKETHKIMNPDIIEQITTEEELSGLLNLCLDSLEELLINKDFSYSKSTGEVKDMWIRQSDSFTAFCYDHIIEDLENVITKRQLRKLFHKYCKIHKIPGASDKAIKVTLESMFGISEFQNSRFERVWEGIKIKNMEVLTKKGQS